MGVVTRTGDDLGEVQPGGVTAEVASFTLGSTPVSPLTLANAYATISAAWRLLRAARDHQDRRPERQRALRPGPQCHQAISRNVADGAAAVLTNVVDGNISGRTGGPMAMGRDAIGKTGTIDTNAAVWFAGATPDLAAAVWVGDPRGGYGHPLHNITINGRYYPEVFGSSLPGPIWRPAMLGALASSAPVPMDLQNEWGLLPPGRSAAHHLPGSARSTRKRSTVGQRNFQDFGQ